MSRSSPIRRIFIPVIVLAVILVASRSLVAQNAPKGTPFPDRPVAALVSEKALQPLMPMIDGWTKGRTDAAKGSVSETCTYTFAYAAFIQGQAKIRLTIADTGFDRGALEALATMISAFPEDYSGVLPPAMAVTRVSYKNWPAASLWDSKANDGEFTVVVGGRFVVKAEGSGLENPDLLRAAVDLIDLKGLAALK